MLVIMNSKSIRRLYVGITQIERNPKASEGIYDGEFYPYSHCFS